MYRQDNQEEHNDEKGCAPNCATVTEIGELVLGYSGSKL